MIVKKQLLDFMKIYIVNFWSVVLFLLVLFEIFFAEVLRGSGDIGIIFIYAVPTAFFVRLVLLTLFFIKTRKDVIETVCDEDDPEVTDKIKMLKTKKK